MGAYTSVTTVGSGAMGTSKQVSFTLVGPASYDTGGSIVDLSTTTLGVELGFTTINSVVVNSNNVKHTTNYKAGASAALGKISVMDNSVADGGDEVANTTDLSGTTFNITVTGR